jgi:photosystem II stability/assembly factor-like uncharacterized protein
MDPFLPTRPRARLARTLLALAALAVLAPGCAKSTKPKVVPPLSKVVLTPPLDTLQVDQLATFTATAYDTNLVPVTVAFEWTSTNPYAASVNIVGQVKAHNEGTALIIAAAGGKSDTSLVAVYPDTGWIAQTSNANEDLNGVFFRPDGQTGWAVGAAGLLLSTVDAGATWRRDLLTNFTLNGVVFWTDVYGIVVGNGGTVLLSGPSVPGQPLNWFRPDTLNASEALYDVTYASSFGDSGIAWAVGQNGVILRSINLGHSWQKQFIPGGSTLRSVAFSSTKDGWAAGDNGVLAGTHDRGVTWFVVSPSVTGVPLRSVAAKSALRNAAAGTNGTITRTAATPDSIAWTLENAGNTLDLHGIAFGDSVLYAVGAQNLAGGVWRSDDFGVTWLPQVAHAQFPLKDVYFVDRQHGWAVGNNGQIRHTARGGTK